MKETTILLMLATIISKILGLFRDIVLGNFYGSSDISEAYTLATSIPSVIFAAIGAGIATGYIPLYTTIEKKLDIKEANKFTSNVVNIVMVLCTIVVMFSLIFTKEVVKLFALGFEGERLRLTILFTRFTIVGVYFTALVSIFTAYLNLKNNFLIPAFISIPMNICILISIVLSSNGSVVILSLGAVVAMGLQVVFLIPFIRKTGYKHKLILNRKDEHVKKMIALATPVIIGTSVNQINLIVDKNIASLISDHTVFLLNNASRLNGFVQGIFVVTIVTAMYPLISRMCTDGNIEGLKSVLKQSIVSVSILIIPITIGTMIFSNEVVRVLFERGKFNSQDTYITSGLLFFYSIGMIGYALREVISKAFYSLQDSKTPMKNAVFAVIINIVLSITLSRFLGINALALSTSIAGIVCTITLFISLRKKIGHIRLKYIVVSEIKILLSSLIMGLCAKQAFLYLTLKVSEFLSLFVSVFIGALVYFIIMYFMKIDEVNSILSMFKNKIK